MGANGGTTAASAGHTGNGPDKRFQRIEEWFVDIHEFEGAAAAIGRGRFRVGQGHEAMHRLGLFAMEDSVPLFCPQPNDSPVRRIKGHGEQGLVAVLPQRNRISVRRDHVEG